MPLPSDHPFLRCVPPPTFCTFGKNCDGGILPQTAKSAFASVRTCRKNKRSKSLYTTPQALPVLQVWPQRIKKPAARCAKVASLAQYSRRNARRRFSPPKAQKPPVKTKRKGDFFRDLSFFAAKQLTEGCKAHYNAIKRKRLWLTWQYLHRHTFTFTTLLPVT